jgi:hypothetical protein
MRGTIENQIRVLLGETANGLNDSLFDVSSPASRSESSVDGNIEPCISISSKAEMIEELRAV